MMLGIDAPISALIVRDTLLKSVYAFFLGWPIYFGDAPRPAPGAGRGAAGRAPAPADRPGGLGHVPALRRTRPADEQPPGAAVGDLRRRRAGPLRGPLLPALVPAGASTATKYLAEAKQQPHPRVPGQRPARRRSSTATARCWSPTAPASRCRSTRNKLPPKTAAAPSRDRPARRTDPQQLRRVRKTIHEERKLAPGGAGDAPPRRRPLPRLLPEENQDRFPGVDRAAGLRPRLPGRDAGRPHPRQRRRDHRRRAEGTALPRPAAGRRDRPGRGRGHLRPLPARQARA